LSCLLGNSCRPRITLGKHSNFETGRTDPAFRKQIRKESKRQARAAREEAEQEKINSRAAIKNAVRDAQAEGFPTDVEEKEAYFMQEVSRGETLSGEGAKS
jgi:import receptor subunit TOM20